MANMLNRLTGGRGGRRGNATGTARSQGGRGGGGAIREGWSWPGDGTEGDETGDDPDLLGMSASAVLGVEAGGEGELEEGEEGIDFLTGTPTSSRGGRGGGGGFVVTGEEEEEEEVDGGGGGGTTGTTMREEEETNEEGAGSGILQGLALGGELSAGDERLSRELAWQREVNGESAKITTFRAQVGAQQSFRAFVFMKPKTPLIQVAHSIGQYHGFSGLAPELQDRHIAFVGDRTAEGGNPTPVVLPVRNAWDWARVNVCKNAEEMEAFYENGENARKLWPAAAGGAAVQEVHLPRMLAIPSVVAHAMARKGPCLPHQVRKMVKEIIAGGESQVPEAEWKLVLEWCVAAAQVDGQGSSVLMMDTEMVSTQDPEVRRWCAAALVRTLGPAGGRGGENAGGGGKHGGGGMDTVERVATRVSQGVVSGLRALAPTLAMAAGRGRADEKMGEGEQVGGKRFSEEQVATLKGYCGVVDERKIPDIWRTFQATKHIATWRATLLAAMEDWEDSHKGGGESTKPRVSRRSCSRRSSSWSSTRGRGWLYTTRGRKELQSYAVAQRQQRRWRTLRNMRRRCGGPVS